MPKIIVTEDEKDIRIDNFLAQKTDISRSKIQSLIKEHQVTVNGNYEKSSYKVQINDEVEYKYILEEKHLKPEKIDLDIIYEDEDILVINKPNGLVVHPAPGNYQHTLANALSYYASNLSNINGEFRPGIVHRIDAFTTGLLVVAKNNKIHEILAAMIAKKEIKRTYIALVWGIIKEDTGTIDAPIGRDLKDRKKMAVVASGKPAITHFKVLERFKNATLLEITLETGRTHQIRVHMNYINHPIVNDPTYGNHSLIDDSGQMLHAKYLDFIHPKTKEKMHFEAELPEKFTNILNKFKEV